MSEPIHGVHRVLLAGQLERAVRVEIHDVRVWRVDGRALAGKIRWHGRSAGV